jgi:hypothetical protein
MYCWVNMQEKYIFLHRYHKPVGVDKSKSSNIQWFTKFHILISFTWMFHIFSHLVIKSGFIFTMMLLFLWFPDNNVFNSNLSEPLYPNSYANGLFWKDLARHVEIKTWKHRRTCGHVYYPKLNLLLFFLLFGIISGLWMSDIMFVC